MGYLMEMYDEVYVYDALENVQDIVYVINRSEVRNDECMSKLLEMHVLKNLKRKR